MRCRHARICYMCAIKSIAQDLCPFCRKGIDEVVLKLCDNSSLSHAYLYRSNDKRKVCCTERIKNKCNYRNFQILQKVRKNVYLINNYIKLLAFSKL